MRVHVQHVYHVKYLVSDQHLQEFGVYVERTEAVNVAAALAEQNGVEAGVYERGVGAEMHLVERFPAGKNPKTRTVRPLGASGGVDLVTYPQQPKEPS